VYGKVLGTIEAKVQGFVYHPDTLQNGQDVLYFESYMAYWNIGQFPDECVTDPDHCRNGITVSFVVHFEDAAKNWTTNTSIVNTIGDKTLIGKRGFAVYVVNSRLYVTVISTDKTWTVSEPLLTNAWQHVMFTWQLEKGLVLYKNGNQR